MDNRKEQTSATYDEMFSEGGYQGCYDLPYKYSPYFPMYKAVFQLLEKHQAKSILEVGCGSGAFAQMVFDSFKGDYAGFDFSNVAIEQCQKRTGRPASFKVGDATNSEAYSGDYDAIVCTEVLEHVPGDLSCIELWSNGKLCICSVPNYDSKYHVRYFTSDREVRERYGDLIDIRELEWVNKPPVHDLRISTYLTYMRWNRYRPTKLLHMLGFGDFSSRAGWFVFAGYKK